MFHLIFSYIVNVALENHSVQSNPSIEEEFHKQNFGCYVCYVLHYGVKLSMLPKFV